MDLEVLKEWFLEEKRDLPWRENRTPYRVLISEVMLQQTQVATVIPYFERWMQKFPTLEILAAASEEEVVKMWEGLGYYSRARRLLRSAKELAGRDFPKTREELEKISGIGPYTAGAILSFAFQKKAAAVDGNVVRVLSRLFACREKASEKGVYQKLCEEALPEHEAWVVMEALIELGSEVCQRKPKCFSCPLREQCHSHAEGLQALLPIKERSVKITQLRREVAVLFFGDEVLLRQVEPGKVMGGLYEFPYREEGEKWPFEMKSDKIETLDPIKHRFTRYEATLFPTLYLAPKREEVAGYVWVEREKLKALPFSSGHRKIVQGIST